MEPPYVFVDDEAIRRKQAWSKSALNRHSAHKVLATVGLDTERLNLMLHRFPSQSPCPHSQLIGNDVRVHPLHLWLIHTVNCKVTVGKI